MSAERKTTPYEQVAWGAYPDKIFASEKKSQRGKHGINFFSVFGILVGIILPIIFFLLLDFDWSPVLKYLFSVKGMIGLLPAFLFLAFMSLRTFGTQKFTALKYGQKWPIAAVGADGFLMARRGQLYQKRPSYLYIPFVSCEKISQGHVMWDRNNEEYNTRLRITMRNGKKHVYVLAPDVQTALLNAIDNHAQRKIISLPTGKVSWMDSPIVPSKLMTAFSVAIIAILTFAVVIRLFL